MFFFVAVQIEVSKKAYANRIMLCDFCPIFNLFLDNGQQCFLISHLNDFKNCLTRALLNHTDNTGILFPGAKSEDAESGADIKIHGQC